MSSTLYRNFILTAIALLLAAIAFKPVAFPPAAYTQSDSARYYFEPRT